MDKGTSSLQETSIVPITDEMEKSHEKNSLFAKKKSRMLKKTDSSRYSSESESTIDVLYEKKDIAQLQHLAIRSIVIICVTAGLDGCDEQLLPASLRALEIDMNLNPKQLGNIILTQLLCLSLSCPIWGYFADRHSRKKILATGVTMWGLVTCLLAFASQFWQVVLIRGINGIFLGSVGPLAQSILADTMKSKNRGFGFGLVQLSSCIGRVFGSVLTTSISQETIAGFSGWRVAFLLVGSLSFILGVLVFTLMDEIPHLHLHKQNHSYDQESGHSRAITSSAPIPDTGGMDEMQSGSESRPLIPQESTPLQFIKSVIVECLTTKSVLILIAEGITGTIPWSSLTFMTMFLQYCGLTNFHAAMVIAIMLIGSMIGGPLGGLAADLLNRRLPDHGRPLMGQISMIVRIPILAALFVIVPHEATSMPSFTIAAFFIGLAAIAGVASNRPILSDVVPAHQRATIFSLSVLFEGTAAAAFGAPIVGLLAQNTFGYIKTDLPVSEMTEALRLNNARALAYALLLLTIVPWSVSLLLYSSLHLTYGDDKRRLKERLQSIAADDQSTAIHYASSDDEHAEEDVLATDNRLL